MFPHVYVLFVAELKTQHIMAGQESLDITLVYPEEID
jgi:hypothetical protein